MVNGDVYQTHIYLQETLLKLFVVINLRLTQKAMYQSTYSEAPTRSRAAGHLMTIVFLYGYIDHALSQPQQSCGV
jgi:hypothetical protein